MSASWQVTQADLLLHLNSNHVYVALISLWLYDYILCLPDAVTYLVESRWGFCTFLYFTCSHLPCVFLIFDLLVCFQPDAPIPICRTYNIINSYVGVLTVLCAEGIFILRLYAVWERGRRFAVYAVISIIVYLAGGVICLYEINFSVPEPCWIPGIIRNLDTKTRSMVVIAFSLLIVSEIQILLFLLYGTVKNQGGWRIGNRLMTGLLRQNALYCCCGFAFSLSVIIAAIFLPFPVVHVLVQSQVVVQSVMVTRMHRDFWRSDRLNASCGISTDTSLVTWMARTPNLV